ncbi:MAG: Cys-Cys-COOH (seleno)protein SaoC [Desulfopila sp.]
MKLHRAWRSSTGYLAILAIFFAVLVVLLIRRGSGSGLQETGDQKDFTAAALSENEMLQFFSRRHPGQTILKYAQADLDNDNRDDLIVIYRLSPQRNEMSIIHFPQDRPTETNAVPAPVTDQIIQFRDIDDKPPLEFILQGRKGAKVGYAIFRIEEGQLVDLFGEGMEDCC